MLVSMLVRCEQCGHESDPRYRFCGMCGAKLPPPPAPPLPRPEPVAAKPAREEKMQRVSGPSFLGLAEEPSSSVSYLLEDEMSESHWGRALVLLVILAALGAAGWHWRSEIRAYVVARLAQHPNNGQPEQTSYPGGAVSTSASETALQTPNASTPVENQNAATSPTPASAAGQQPSVTTNNTAASGEQANTAPAAAPSAPASTPAAPAQTSQGSPPAASATTQEQAGAAPAGNEPGSGEQAANEQTPKAEAAAAKRAKSRVNETAEAKTSADELEAEGERYLYGTGVSPNCSRAQRDLQAAAEQGSSKADSVLGTMYATGHCVSRDLPLAYRWFAMALQHDPGNTRLQSDLQVLWNQMTADERQIAMRRQ